MRGRRSITTRWLVAVVAATGGLAIAIALIAFPPRLSTATVHRALVLMVLTAAAELFAISVKHGESAERITMFELAVIADIVLLPPSIAALTSILGLALALIVRRRPPLKFAFNLGQYAAGIVPVVALYHGIGHGDFNTTAGLISLLAGMTLFTASNLVTISAIIAVTADRPLFSVIREERGVSFAMGVGNSAVGLVAASLFLTRPALLPAVLAPTIALQLAFRGWVKEKELSREMAEQSTKLGRILEHSSEGIVLADADGAVLLWSPSMAQITGVSTNEAVGKALTYLLRGKDVWGKPMELDVSQDTEPVEIEIVTTAGATRWLRVQHGPGHDERGALTFDVLLVTDVTRQREVDRLKDDFFNTVSHELRTPLTPIKGYASLLLRRGDDIPANRRQEALQSIVERTDHMARLVEDLLIASRVANAAERRMPEMQMQVVGMHAIAEKALRSFRASHPTREFTLSGDDADAIGDSIRLDQIIANLVSNAVKFSPDGTDVDITIARDESCALLSVKDNGRGIPSDRFDEIFEKFKRLEDPMVMETGGAGLGLFIVKQLAKAMGGDVSITSEIGTGSTFTVRIPLAAAGAAQTPLRRAGDPPPGIVPGRGLAERPASG